MRDAVHRYALTRGEWIHLDYRKEEARHWLTEESGLDPVVIRALQLKDPRPRTHFQGGGILISLRGVNLNAGSEPNDMVGVRIWIDKKRIITSNHRKLHSVKDVTLLAEEGRAGQTPFDVFILLCQRLVSRIDDVIDKYEESLLDLETEVLNGKSSLDRSELMLLRQQLILLRRYVTPQREALARLVIEPIPWVDAKKMLHIREVSDHQIRILENIDALRERAVITHEELVSRVSDQLNNRLYRLSIISAIFLPLGFLTGLLGVNLGGIPGAQSGIAFLFFIVLLLIVLSFQLLFFRWKKWL